jgi:peroxiredoxin Q/BCP
MKRLYLFLAALAISIFSLFAQAPQSKLKPGDKAPDFTLPDANGKMYTLSSYEGKSPVIVYFYPKAGTAGCTAEACGIRDDWSKFKENNIPVLGISVDNKEAIQKFIKDNNLNFPLLSDQQKKVSKEYDVLNKRGMDNRITFIVDKNGKIADVIAVTDIPGHSKEVLNKALALK